MFGFLIEKNSPCCEGGEHHLDWYKKSAFNGNVVAQKRLEDEGLYFNDGKEYKRVENDEDYCIYLSEIQKRINEPPEQAEERTFLESLNITSINKALERILKNVEIRKRAGHYYG